MRNFAALNNILKCPDAVLHLHADGYNPDTGVWADWSGRGNNATQTNASFRPTKSTNASGHTTVNFGSKFLSVPSSTATFSFLNQRQGVVFIVGRIGTNVSPATFWITGRLNSSDKEQGLYFNGNNTTARVFIRNTSTLNLVDDTTISANSQFLLVHDFTNANKSLNSTTETAITISGTLATGNNSYDLHIGATANQDFSLPVGSYINEFIIFNAITGGRKNQIIQALKNRYGV